MSPLALYIEQVGFHEPRFSPSVHPTIAVYPLSPPNNQIFGSLHSSPMLEKVRTNRVLAYRGSFNPPHRGHLHLLKHTFMRGTHDLNVVAAVIIPASDQSLAKKEKTKNGNFMFGLDERCLLWEHDICFPPWAWVYKKSGTEFCKFSERLIQATKKDGYALEFVPLYGADAVKPSSPPGSSYGCKTIIVSDAARKAEFQRSSGRLRNFDDCTNWRGLRIPKDRLRNTANVMAYRALLAVRTICPADVYSMLEDGHAYIKEVTETGVAKAVEELKSVVTCTLIQAFGNITLRFVKCDDVDPRADYNDISSTSLREVMRKKKGVKLREALDWMALSADVLWRHKASWIDKAKLGQGCCINFDQLPELPVFYEEPPHFDDPPSLEELGLAEAVEPFTSIEEPPPLERPTSLDDSPAIEEPQSLVEPMPVNNKKRRFSETGLEDDGIGDDGIEVLGESANGRLIVAEDVERQKPESCIF